MSSISYCPTSGKIVYRTRRAADRAARKRGAGRHDGKAPVEMFPYPCGDCDGFHIASRLRRVTGRVVDRSFVGREHRNQRRG